MAESINNKNADRSYIRELQQDKNAKKKELAMQQREDIKQIKTFYAEKNKEVDDESSAAISHIKTDQTESDHIERQAKIDERRAELDEKQALAEEKAAAREDRASESSVRASTYNRDGKINSSEKKTLKPASTQKDL